MIRLLRCRLAWRWVSLSASRAGSHRDTREFPNTPRHSSAVNHHYKIEPCTKYMEQRYARKCSWKSQPNTKGQTSSATGQPSAANGTGANALTGGGIAHRSTSTRAVAE